MKANTLGPKGKRLLRLLVKQIRAGRFQKYRPETFISYSEVLERLRIRNPTYRAGRRLQPEGLNELNDWTKSAKVSPRIPHVAGLIVNKAKPNRPSVGYPKSHNFTPGANWETWWLEETARAIVYNWSPYL
jgi:hypothetical protein